MRCLRFVFVVGLLLLLPAIASAQSSLAGVAKDTSGAVLPGVTVEAASPALIEKVRSVTTDASGQYKIVDLRPGTYTVTFSLTGFSVVKREGIELGGSGTVQVNADMKVGTLEETITVSGETPIVDVQNAARQQVLNGDLVANTPAAKSWNGIMLLIPGVTGDPNTVQLTPGMVLFGIHGGPTTEGRLQVDGMNVGASRGGGGVSGYSVDTANVQEISFRTSGGLGEAETGGPLMNIVPRTGGNTFRGSSGFQYAELVVPERQLRRLPQKQAERAQPDSPAVGRGFRARRPDQEGQALVLLPGPLVWQRDVGDGHVRERERRQPELMVVHRRQEPAGTKRQLDDGQRAPRHVADESEEQAEPLLGRAARVQRRPVDRDDGLRLPRDA